MVLRRYVLAANGARSDTTHSVQPQFQTGHDSPFESRRATPALAYQKNKSHHLAHEVKWNIPRLP